MPRVFPPSLTFHPNNVKTRKMNGRGCLRKSLWRAQCQRALAPLVTFFSRKRLTQQTPLTKFPTKKETRDIKKKWCLRQLVAHAVDLDSRVEWRRGEKETFFNFDFCRNVVMTRHKRYGKINPKYIIRRNIISKASQIGKIRSLTFIGER